MLFDEKGKVITVVEEEEETMSLRKKLFNQRSETMMPSLA